MGQTLTNGIFLPNEGERNCYTGLAGNWRAIDGYIGDYNVHVADAVIHVSQADRDKWDAVDDKADASALTAHTGDTTIHVTAADKEAWNGKADASALTAHTGNTTIHVTAADKEAWNGKADASALTAHTGNTTIHVTAADKNKWDAVTSKANDTDVLHLTGDESAAGDKNFQGLLTTIPSASLWPNVSNNTDDITFLGRSVIHIEYKSSGQLTDLSGGAWSVAELGAGCFFFRINNGTDIRFKNVATGEVNRIPVVAGTNRFINDVSPNQDNTYDLGSASYRWRTLNGINPGALSLPDLTAGVDISAYITNITGASNINKFTPTADGWISIGLSNADFIEIYIPSSLIGGSFTKSTVNNFGQAFMPVIANKEVRLALKGSSIGWAKFYPCQGNI